MRLAARDAIADYEQALAIPYQVLADVEARAPDVIAGMLAMPQFGAWADDCVRRLLAGTSTTPGGSRRDVAPLGTDLGHLALFAAGAAMRAGLPFRLSVPLREGTACLPGRGTARPGAHDRWEWGLAWRDEAGSHIQSTAATVAIPDQDPARPDDVAAGDAGWRPFFRFTASVRGLRLDVTLDDADPFLDRYDSARVQVTGQDRAAWQQLLASAWQVLASGAEPLATLIAGTVRTLVPIASAGPTRPAETSDAASFGAIALSLPEDALQMAEILVHESHHAVLGALLDIEPMVRDDADEAGFLAYAPWRDDPRPAGALLQGIFAHYGMGRFWRQQFVSGPAAGRRRAAVEFGRMRAMTSRAASTLAGSGMLTDAGGKFLEVISHDVSEWHGDPLPAVAEQDVADLTTDHESRWRVSHLQPDPDAIRVLADAWARGDPPPFPPDMVAVRIQPGPLPAPSANIRSYLLTFRYQRPELLPGHLAAVDGPPDQADAALTQGKHDEAAGGYLRRIARGRDPDAWAGLATARRWTGPGPVATLYAGRPELIFALHALVAAGGGQRRDPTLPDRLARWLAEGQAAPGTR